MRQELTQAIENTARAVVNDIHTALPGEIVSFDADKNMAVVHPVGKFVTTDGTSFDYPQIADVPLVFPYCATANVGIAFPVKAGDSCIIIISETELDEWRSGAVSEGPLRFDLTSAVAIPGLLKQGNGLVSKAVTENSVVVGAGNTLFSVSENGIAVRGDLKVEGNISYTESLIKL